MPYKDPEKRREIQRKNYQKNKKNISETVQKRKRMIRKWFNELRANLSCSTCEEDHQVTIDFHHKKGREKFQVALMAPLGIL